MIVKVIFWRKMFPSGEEGYIGQPTYFGTELPLKPGDIVSAPTPLGASKAIVTSVNVPVDDVSDKELFGLKYITAYPQQIGG